MEMDSLDTLGDMFTYKEWIKQKDSESKVETDPIITKKVLKKKKGTGNAKKSKSKNGKPKATKNAPEKNGESKDAGRAEEDGFRDYVQSIDKCTSITRLFNPSLAKVLETARKKGFEPRTLADVLYERNKLWAKTQCIHSSAKEDFLQHTQLYRKQFWGYKKSVDGWITETKNSNLGGLYGNREKKSGKIWSNIIYCPNFKPGGEVIHRFSRKTSRTYKTLYDCIVDGWVHPDLVVCEIIDATHPVRFATPPEQDCYTAIYVGPEISADSPRVVFGEYTGIVYHEDSIEDSVFEYAFELNFTSGSWINADYADTEEMVNPAYKNFDGHSDKNLEGRETPYFYKRGHESVAKRESNEDSPSIADFTFGILNSNGEPCNVRYADAKFAHASRNAEHCAYGTKSGHYANAVDINGPMDLDLIPIGDIDMDIIDQIPMKLDDTKTKLSRISDELASTKMNGSASTRMNGEMMTMDGEMTSSTQSSGRVLNASGRPADCVYLPSTSRYVLDSTTACNELSLVNHCQTISAYGGEFWIQPNCEWQQVIFDGWPHIVLTSKEGVKISPGDELVADFGALWFAKVEEMAHKSLRREVIEYRTGIRSKVAKRQTILHSRPLEDVDRWLVNTGHFGTQFTCAICNDQDEEDYREETACLTTPCIPTEESTEECVSCDGCDRVFHLSCIKNLSGTAANVFAKQDGLIVWKTDTEPFKGDRDYALGKWFCMYCRYLAKQIYMHDVGSDYMPTSRSIWNKPFFAPFESTHSTVQTMDACVQTNDNKTKKHVRNKISKSTKPVHSNFGSSSSLIPYLHKTYFQHESNHSGSEFDRIMHKIFKKHKMHKMRAIGTFSPLQITTDIMRNVTQYGLPSDRRRQPEHDAPKGPSKLSMDGSGKGAIGKKEGVMSKMDDHNGRPEGARRAIMDGDNGMETTRSASRDDTPSTRAFTPINRRDKSSSTRYDVSCAPTYRSDGSYLPDIAEMGTDFISDAGFLSENIKRVQVGAMDGFTEYTHTVQDIKTCHTDMNTFNDIGVTDYLTCRHLLGMWQLESFSLFGDTVRVCSECNQRSGPRANVYVCRILKRHLGGNFDHPESTNVAQMREYVLMAYEQHVHFLLRLLVLKNISIHYLVKTCCHFISKQLLYNKDLSFSETEVMEAINPSLINLKGLVNKNLCKLKQEPPKTSKTAKGDRSVAKRASKLSMGGNGKGVTIDKKGEAQRVSKDAKKSGKGEPKKGGVKKNVKGESKKDVKGESKKDVKGGAMNEKGAQRVSMDGEKGEDQSDAVLAKLTEFLSGITATVLKAPRFDGLFNYGLLRAMGAFTEEYTRIINCDEIVRYINDLTTYISYDGDQLPGHLQQMLNKAEIERFSNFKHLSQKTESPFSEQRAPKFVKKKERIVFVPLLGITPGRSLVYRKFSDGYYQGTVTEHDVHRGVHVSFRIEYSDGDDEIMHPEELLEEILLNIGDSEKILRELSENDSSNEHYLSRLGQSPDIQTVKRLAGKLRKVLIKSLMPPKIGVQKRQYRL